MLLNDVLDIFLSHLEKIPYNLTNASLALLCTLTIIDITNMVFKLDETDWVKWLIAKTMKVGMLLFIIKNYTYLLKEVRLGFVKIGNLALGKDLSSSTLLSYPSKIIDMSWNLTSQMWELVGVNPKSWIFLIIMFLTILGFAFIAFQVIITWIEFYLLCGISIIFIPFGTIKVGENYYTNVLKTIVGCSIKLCILNILLLLSEDILNELVLINSKIHSSITLMCVVLILAYLIMSIPNLATSLLTGSPTLSANDALRAGVAGLTTAIAGLTMASKTLGKGLSTTGSVARGGGQIASGTLDGIKGGVDLGGISGGLAGSVFGPTGEAIGSSLGKIVGGVAGGTLGGMYSAGKLGVDNLAQRMGYGNLSSKGTSNIKGTGVTSGSKSQGTGDVKGAEATPESNNQETSKLKSKDIWNNQTSTGEVRLNDEKIGDNK